EVPAHCSNDRANFVGAWLFCFWPERLFAFHSRAQNSHARGRKSIRWGNDADRVHVPIGRRDTVDRWGAAAAYPVRAACPCFPCSTAGKHHRIPRVLATRWHCSRIGLYGNGTLPCMGVSKSVFAYARHAPLTERLMRYNYN